MSLGCIVSQWTVGGLAVPERDKGHTSDMEGLRTFLRPLMKVLLDL
jgi:hypothetical protein